MKTYLLHPQGGAHAGGQANDIKFPILFDRLDGANTNVPECPRM